jgi:hypothetical protein
MKRAVRTVQRWEQCAGVPVRRPRPGERSPVFAFQEESCATSYGRTKRNIPFVIYPPKTKPVLLQSLMTQTPQGDALRRSPRFQCDKPFRLLTPTSDDYFPGTCLNRGDGGFAASVPCELEVGQTITVEFKPHGVNLTVRLQARVVHSLNGAYGFEFVAPSIEHRTAIARLFKEM